MQNLNILDSEVVFGHKVCQTSNAKWLCIDKIYPKLHRPNYHDIGGTYIEDVADFWFIYQTEIVADIHLLHLYVNNRPEGSFDISVSSDSNLSINRKHKKAFLPSVFKTYKFDNRNELSLNYITTYSFSAIDVELLIDMKLYIPVSFGNKTPSSSQPIDEITVDYDFKSLLTDPIASDFVIESAEGAKFEVHKSILSAHSEVFKAMLKENTSESQNSYLKMVDVAKEDLQHILEFIYTGTIEDIDNANFLNLLILSDRYNLTGLKEISEHALCNQMTVDNCIETLAVADLHNCEDLKCTVLKFIKCNKKVVYSDMFSELNNVELIREVCQFLVPSS